MGSRGSDYAELSRLVRAAGLLDRRPGYYRVRIALTVASFAVGWTAFALLGASWWQLVTAAFLAVVFVQLGFLGHDAGHRQVFRSRRHNDLLGLLCANLLIGLSYSWWIENKPSHHANPNHVDRDPDITAGGVVFTRAQARARRSGVGRWCARHQAALFFPMLLLEGVALHIASIRARGASPRPQSAHRVGAAGWASAASSASIIWVARLFAGTARFHRLRRRMPVAQQRRAAAGRSWCERGSSWAPAA